MWGVGVQKTLREGDERQTLTGLRLEPNQHNWIASLPITSTDNLARMTAELMNR